MIGLQCARLSHFFLLPFCFPPNSAEKVLSQSPFPTPCHLFSSHTNPRKYAKATHDALTSLDMGCGSGTYFFHEILSSLSFLQHHPCQFHLLNSLLPDHHGNVTSHGFNLLTEAFLVLDCPNQSSLCCSFASSSTYKKNSIYLYLTLSLIDMRANISWHTLCQIACLAILIGDIYDLLRAGYSS